MSSDAKLKDSLDSLRRATDNHSDTSTVSRAKLRRVVDAFADLQAALTKAERERDQARQRATALLCELDTATRERTKAENLLTVWREEATEVVEAFSNYRNARFDPSDHAEIRRINAIDRLISINKRTDRAHAEAGEGGQA